MRNREFLSQTDVVNFFAKSGLLTTYNIARKADATSTKRAAHTGSSSQDNQAERAGFEPARAFTLRALQARALDQAMRPLHKSRTASRVRDTVFLRRTPYSVQ